MRHALLCLLIAAAACSSKDAPSRDDSSGRRSTKAIDDTLREQARFDSERRPEEVVAALGIGPGDRVADIGAGTGLLTVHLARAVAPDGTVVATDIDGAVLELLHSRLSAAGLDEVVERRVVGPETPGLETGAYGAILLAEVDHYFAEPIAWLRSVAQALAPDGRIVISNRIHHRTRSMAAAEQAGLVLQSESTPVPTHFIAVFVAPPTNEAP